MRPLVLIALFIGLPLATVFAQPFSSASPTLSLSAPAGSLSMAHHLHGQNFPANVSLLAILIDPVGNEVVLHPQTGADGSFDLDLVPPSSGWQQGLYRIAVSQPGGRSVSSTFTAGDGAPHLYASPSLPSPFSALSFMGTGFPANSPIDVQVDFAGGYVPPHDYRPVTDANGTFTFYVWPDQIGETFWTAGPYRVSAPSLGLGASLTVREHPLSSAIRVDGPVYPDLPTPVHFTGYGTNRFLWGVVAGPDGSTAAEFLVGPTDITGAANAALAIPNAGTGRYHLATPYDWGETWFDVVVPTTTATPSPTPTSTPTPTPTPVPTPDPRTLRALKIGALATFSDAGETFRVWVTNPQTIRQLKALRAGTSTASIPNGRILRGPGKAAFNQPWNWHLDPKDTILADVTIEVCDGRPSYVAQHVDDYVNTIMRYCPWGAQLVSLQLLPSPPKAPTGLRVIGVHMGKTSARRTTVTLRWQDQSNNESGFRVRAVFSRLHGGSDGQSWQIKRNATTAGVTFIAGGINPVSRACFTVAAFNAVGESGQSTRACIKL